jgi:hypothetical protein
MLLREAAYSVAKIKTIQIAFNLEDPCQKRLFDYYNSKGKNKSLYGKMLIQSDMDRNSSVEPIKANDFKEIKIAGGLKLINK